MNTVKTVFSKSGHLILIFKNVFFKQFWMATSANKSVKLCTTEARALYTGSHAYSNDFAEAWVTLTKYTDKIFLIPEKIIVKE